jgi:hypothetical protein
VHAVGYAFNVDVEQDTDSVAEQRAVRAWLVGELSRIPLYAGENILGRDDGVTMVDDTTVSRRHARVIIGADGVTIEDLHSARAIPCARRVDAGRQRRQRRRLRDRREHLGAVACRRPAAEAHPVHRQPSDWVFRLVAGR